MPLFFNLDILHKKAKGDPFKIVQLLSKYYLEKSNNTYISTDLKGKGFLINPKELFSSKENDVYKAQYIILASKRDYFLYNKYGITNLQLSYYPDINIEKIKYNPLLIITETEISFLYE
jgi:hypothetical protein